ncbi:glycerophosphodiester phosphodiesterase [Cohnella lupini]|uniref:Glycerophosphoryl diester phosphodiesterase n=1 Tax=Cohnella lupini TaxID=1294267 RepID=A0A3D9I1V7_9BACL|nr:glycerophosphodiester phosphodiesterase family protein [Cohnella lupini]RED55747.1 glycerophosphoryl diester phosphodiesterase [Cohnella lupini]
MLLIAHRGGTDRYPELTLEASQCSLELGADYVELDIRFTKDNVPVIAHDSDALRLFGNSSKISDLTEEQFKSLKYLLNDSCHPHTLEEVLKSGVAPILFHIKEGGSALTRILEYIRAHGYEDKVIMGVVTVGDVRLVKAFNHEIKVLAFIPSKEAIMEFIEQGADIIRLWEPWVDEPSVSLVQQAGKQVWIMAAYGGIIGNTSAEKIVQWKHMGIDGVLADLVAENKALL